MQLNEGLRTTAYRDTGGVLTIGYGHTGPDVYENLVITAAQAELQLRATLAALAQVINRNARREYKQQEFDALVDFAFNEGDHALTGSILWTMAQVDADAARITYEFNRWVFAKVAGRFQPLASLQKRRAREASLYLTGSWTA